MLPRRPNNLNETARLTKEPTDSVNKKRKKLGAAIAAPGEGETPYGLVVKEMELGDVKLPYICPFALLWSLCNASVACPDAASAAGPDASVAGPDATSAAGPDVSSFATFLRSCFQRGQKGRIVIYVDEIIPGNPLKHVPVARSTRSSGPSLTTPTGFATPPWAGTTSASSSKTRSTRCLAVFRPWLLVS